jgi:16S rRNA (uracil1498-N3)-methyltransferase
MLYSFFDGNFSDLVRLSPRESHHLISVRRGKSGETVTVLNGRGGIAKGRIESANPQSATIFVVEQRDVARLGAPLWLAQAMPLGKTMDAIVQKAAELGTVRITPLITERSELRLDPERTARKLEKWNQEAIEAVKQCGNPFLPHIDAPATIGELIKSGISETRMVCSLEDGAKPFLRTILETDTKSGIVIAIGPEGDFSTAEYEIMRANRFIPISLGPLVLRSDTAATAALAIAAEATRMK